MKTIGCLCIHGFTGSPFEVEPLAKYLKQNTGWKVVVPTLPGHEENGDLGSVLYLDWITCAEKALKDLLEDCDEVYVIGFSMGGIIAGYLASQYPVKKLVLLSAAAKYINIKQLFLDVFEVLKDTVGGDLSTNELYLRYKNKISKTPLRATRQFQALVSANTKVFKEINVPVFIAQGKNDGIVPVKSATFLYNMIPSSNKKLFIEEKAKHLICHCENNKDLFSEIQLFLKETNY